MKDLLIDLKHSLRMFRQHPGFTFVALFTLALGIGCNAAMFSVVNAVLLKPLSFPDPDRIVQFLLVGANGAAPGASVPKFALWREQTRVFGEVAAYDYGSGPGFNLSGGEHAEQVKGIHVTAGYFHLFGATLERGRAFTAEEDVPQGPKVAVISDGLWKRQFGADPKIIGNALRLGDDTYTIVGVMSSRFDWDSAPDLWIPFQFDLNTTDQGHYFLAAGRLRPGVTLEHANAELKLAADQFRRRYPGTFALDAPDGFLVQPLRDSVVSGVRTSLLVLIGAVGLVLLIACANVANLLLVRATGRSREIAIRAAVGAARGRILRQLLTESVLLAVAGGLAGLALGFAGVRALLTASPGNIPRIGQDGACVTLDWRVLLFAFGLSLATGILFGLIPALGSSRADLSLALKESSGRTSSGFRQNKARSSLVMGEVLLAVVLLIGAALLIRTFIALRRVDPGFDPRNVLTVQMSLTAERFTRTATVAQLVRDARQRIEALPGVAAAATTCCLPLQNSTGLPLIVVGRPLSGPSHGISGWSSVSAHYFEAFRIPLLQGRYFHEEDDAGAPPVVIINEVLAKQLWPAGNALGNRIYVGKGVAPAFEGPARQIVGIVGALRDGGLNRVPRPNVYVPVSQLTDGVTALDSMIAPINWVVRTTVEPHTLSRVIGEQLREASGLPVGRVRTMAEVVARSTARETFEMLLLSIFSCAALLLAAIGIYGVMAYSVAQRRQELGIRMALGARGTDVRNMVVWEGMRLAIVGVVLGTAAASNLTQLMANLLFGVKPWDPVVFLFVPILLTAVAFAAVWLPAVRATRVDPAIALRYE